MKLSVANVLKKADELENLQERKKFILENNSVALQSVLKCFFDPRIKFLLPKGKAPYKPTEFDRLEGRLYSEVRKFYLFIEGGSPNLAQLKREQLFIDLLESIDKDDAELLVSMKDKKMPFKGITKNLVERTFPGLIEQ